MTLAQFKTAIATALEKQAAYNTLLSQADEAKDAFDVIEKTTLDHAERILAAASARYGRASIEYEQVGGKRKGTRRRHAAVETEPVPVLPKAA